MFEPISGLELKEHPDSPARAYLEVIFHRIEWSEEAFEKFDEYRESAHHLKEEKEAVFHKLVDLYKAGDLEACYAIGCAYLSGNSGGKRSPELAHPFFLQAAQADHPSAMTSYAYNCRRLNENQDTPETIEWLEKGAQAGSRSAMISLAYRYRDNVSVEQSYTKAEHWFTTAYNRGEKICAYYLGKLYEFHIKDYDNAYKWYKLMIGHRAKDFRQLAWFLNSEAATPEVQKIVSKHFFGKKKKGQITPQDGYCQPILEVLVELGGKGKTKTVLNRVGEKMKSTLKPIDYESHKSNDKQIRWRNTAQWARNKMVNADGRMKKDSPNGVWEISDKGRKWLERQNSP